MLCVVVIMRFIYKSMLTSGLKRDVLEPNIEHYCRAAITELSFKFSESQFLKFEHVIQWKWYSVYCASVRKRSKTGLTPLVNLPEYYLFC